MKSKVVFAVLIGTVVLLSSSFQAAAGEYLGFKCNQFIDNVVTYNSCHRCVDPDLGGSDLNMWTSIGCLKSGSPKDLVSQLLGWGVALGGGIAFILIVVAGFQITTAGGDAKRVKAAQELLTSAIFGLLLIIFSILLLNFIGIHILDLHQWFGV